MDALQVMQAEGWDFYTLCYFGTGDRWKATATRENGDNREAYGATAAEAMQGLVTARTYAKGETKYGPIEADF